MLNQCHLSLFLAMLSSCLQQNPCSALHETVDELHVWLGNIVKHLRTTEPGKSHRKKHLLTANQSYCCLVSVVFACFQKHLQYQSRYWNAVSLFIFLHSLISVETTSSRCKVTLGIWSEILLDLVFWRWSVDGCQGLQVRRLTIR